jgi:bacterioferritin-associated ferredoxin
MPLEPDDTVCYCFHVSLRKIESFCRIEKPQYASQISQCLSAGTGCGWCRPMLRSIHHRLCGEHEPWWRQQAGEEAGPVSQSDQIDEAEAYRAGREEYLKRHGIVPPDTAAEPSSKG